MFKVTSINLSKLLTLITNESVPLTKLDEVKLCLYYIYSTIKPAHAVTSIKQPPALKGNLLLV